jgi:hypothetical protein
MLISSVAHSGTDELMQRVSLELDMISEAAEQAEEAGQAAEDMPTD